MFIPTKPAIDIFSPLDGGGSPRSVVNGEVQVWGAEIEAALNAHDSTLAKLFKGKVISGAYTVTSSEVFGIILATGNSLYSINMPAPVSLGAPALVAIKNASLRGKRIVANIDGGGYTTYMLYPGMSVTLANLGTGAWIIMDDQRYRNLYGSSAAVGGSVKLRVHPAGGDDSNSDGLGDDAPLATLGRAKDIFYYQYDASGNEGIIELMQGQVARENVIFDRTPRGLTQLYLQAANGGATIAHNGGAGVQSRDCGIVTVRRAPGGSGNLRFVSVDGADNPVAGTGLYSTQMSVIDTEEGVEFGNYSSGVPIVAEDAFINIKDDIEFSGGAQSAVQVSGNSGRLIWQGATTVTISTNTNYDITYGGFLNIFAGGQVILGPGINFAGGYTHSGRRYWNRQGGQLFANGNTLPGAVAGLTDAASFAYTV